MYLDGDLDSKNIYYKVIGIVKPSGEPSNTTKMSLIKIAKEGTWKHLLKPNPHKAAGPDKTRPNVLKELAKVITPTSDQNLQSILQTHPV